MFRLKRRNKQASAKAKKSTSSSRRNHLRRRINRFESLESRRLLTGTPGPDGDINDQIFEVESSPVLTAGNFMDGSIATENQERDVDLFPIEITRIGIEHTFTADARGNSQLDTFLRLFNSSGDPLDDDDDDGTSNNGPGDNAEINFTFSTPGRYYLGVSSAGNNDYDANTGENDELGNSVGNYRVTFFDDNDSIEEALPLNGTSNGGSAIGTIDPNTDVDLYRLPAIEDQTFRIEVNGFVELDSFLRIFDDDGDLLASNNNVNGGVDSELTFEFPSTGDFFLGVSSAGNTGYDAEDGTGDSSGTTTGSYSITATEVSSDSDDRISGATELGNLFTSGTRNRSGEIDSDSDVDLFEFEVGRDGSFIEIDVDRPAFGVDSLLRLFRLNADGTTTLVASNDDANAPGEFGAAARDSFIGMSLDRGVYYVGVSGFGNTNYDINTGLGDTDGNSTGDYTIQIQDRLHVDSIVDGNISAAELNDSDNQLREAIEFANEQPGLQTITFRPVVFNLQQTITLAGQPLQSDQLVISDSVTIDGPGSNLLTISGNDESRVFLVDDENGSSQIDVTIHGLAIRNGNTAPNSSGRCSVRRRRWCRYQQPRELDAGSGHHREQHDDRPG